MLENDFQNQYIPNPTQKAHQTGEKGMKEAMNSTQEYYIGLSTAVVSGLRESDIDIFEINYDKPADLAGD